MNKAMRERESMVSYPRVFKLVRKRASRPGEKIGHVADGVEWAPGGQVTLRWRGTLSSVATFGSMDAVKAVHGHYSLVRGEFNTVVEYVDPPAKLDKRVLDEFRALEDVLFDWVDRVQKKTHIDRDALRERFGLIQDLMTEAMAQQEAKKVMSTDWRDAPQ